MTSYRRARPVVLPIVLMLLSGPPLAAQTGITIYNDGRVLMRRTLPVSVPKGASEQRVELGVLDPSSLFSLDPDITVSRAVFDAAEDEAAVQRRLVGKKVSVDRPKMGGGYETYEVTILGVDPLRFIMPDGTVAFNSPGGAIRYPADAVARSPSALLSLSSASAKKALPLGWFTTGASWNASYDVVLGSREARIAGEAVISSQALSVEDADIQLLAGTVSRAASAGNAVAYDLASRKMAMAVAAAPAPAEEAAGGFHLYSLPGRANIRDGTITTVQLFEPASTAYEKRLVMRSQMPWYGYIPQQPEEQVVPVEVSYILKRPLKTPFGDKPLPGGVARIYNPDSEGRLQLVGEASMGHTAAGEDLTLYAGTAFDLTAKRVQTEYVTTPEKRGSVTRTVATFSYKVTIKNGSDSVQVVDVREERGGEWSILQSSVPAEKLSSTAVRFKVTVPAKGEAALTYQVRAVW